MQFTIGLNYVYATTPRSKFWICIECTGVSLKRQIGATYVSRQTRPLPKTVQWETGGRK